MSDSLTLLKTQICEGHFGEGWKVQNVRLAARGAAIAAGEPK